MRRYRRSTPNRPRLQHSPSEMAGSIAGSTLATVRMLATPNSLAGSGAGTARSGADRDKEVDAGSRLGTVTVNLGIRGATASGSIEVGIVKYERQSSVPTVGVDPVPSTADVLSVGLQQALRMASPGWVMKFYNIAYTSETTRTKDFSINLKKFRKATWRDGDYLALLLFNRGTSTVTVDHQARYYEYR